MPLLRRGEVVENVHGSWAYSINGQESLNPAVSLKSKKSTCTKPSTTKFLRALPAIPPFSFLPFPVTSIKHQNNPTQSFFHHPKAPHHLTDLRVQAFPWRKTFHMEYDTSRINFCSRKQVEPWEARRLFLFWCYSWRERECVCA